MKEEEVPVHQMEWMNLSLFLLLSKDTGNYTGNKCKMILKDEEKKENQLGTLEPEE